MIKLRLVHIRRARTACSLALLLGACSSEPAKSSDVPDGSDGSEETEDPAASSDAARGDGGSAPKPKPDGQVHQGPSKPVDGSVGPVVDDAGGSEAGADAGADAGASPDPTPSVPGELPVCDPGPAEFEPNPKVGGGGGQFVDSKHFRIYGASASMAEAAFSELEAAYACFVDTLCWRSSGLSIKDTTDSGPYYKMNFYVVGSLGSAAGQMFSDAATGLSYEKVVGSYLTDPKVAVHEYGHALTYHEKGWVDQTRTGAWWETVANFVADTYMTSPICEKARTQNGASQGKTIIDLNKTIGSSFQVIVDGSSGSGNYYQAWPFLTYLTNNPDGYAGLGATVLRDMFRKHMRNNETPLHVLERIAAPTSVQKIVGRYWARMAYVDIGHEQAQAAFKAARSRLNYANLDATGSGSYKVKAARQPRYFGSNIIPLKGSGKVGAKVTSSAPFTATLAVLSGSGSVRYVDLPNGAGETTLESGEEATLVVVNTPATLYQYDPFSITGDVARGLDYTVTLTGATPAN